MAGLVNKAKEVLTGNKTHDTAPTGHSTSTHGHSGTTHGASTVNPAHSTHTGYTTGEYGSSHNTTTSATGPHSSSVANKLDPRVDSGATSAVGGGYGQTNSGYGATPGHNAATGPHSSNLANKLDPRIDSDADHRNNPTSGAGGYGQTQASSGYAPTSTTGGNATAGPHSSSLANKLDPRVDSNAANSGNNHAGGVGGYGQSQGAYGRPL